MAITLVINPGSSSKKFAFFDGEHVLFTTRFEKTTAGFERCVEVAGQRQANVAVAEPIFTDATAETIRLALEHKIIQSVTEIKRVGIRVVAPGTYFQTHRLIGPEYIAKLQDKSPLAPLHTPLLLREIAAAKAALPEHGLVGVSDSAFHVTKPAVATEYSIDPKTADELDLYRFGYHGLSVGSVWRRLPTVLGHEPQRVIVVHLGSGVSLTALRAGVSVDTTMGYSPESGVMMGTRAGDIDAGALLALMHERRLRPFDAHVYLSTRGGLQGRVGNGDLRYVLERRSQGDQKAAAALAQFAYYIKKTIGSYHAVLGGLDAVVVTATAAFRNPDVRSLVLAGLEHLGIQLATQRNQDLINAEGIIHANGSAVAIVVMQTNEMYEVALACEQFQ